MDTNTTNPNPTPTPPMSEPTPPQEPQHHTNTGMAVLCYIGILVLVPLLTDAKNDPFVKFHIKQGLVLLIGWVVASAIVWLPVFGWLLWAGVFVLMIAGIINAANGTMKELPLIGKLAKNFHF